MINEPSTYCDMPQLPLNTVSHNVFLAIAPPPVNGVIFPLPGNAPPLPPYPIQGTPLEMKIFDINPFAASNGLYQWSTNQPPPPIVAPCLPHVAAVYNNILEPAKPHNHVDERPLDQPKELIPLSTYTSQVKGNQYLQSEPYASNILPNCQSQAIGKQYHQPEPYSSDISTNSQSQAKGKQYHQSEPHVSNISTNSQRLGHSINDIHQRGHDSAQTQSSSSRCSENITAPLPALSTFNNIYPVVQNEGSHVLPSSDKKRKHSPEHRSRSISKSLGNEHVAESHGNVRSYPSKQPSSSSRHKNNTKLESWYSSTKDKNSIQEKSFSNSKSVNHKPEKRHSVSNSHSLEKRSWYEKDYSRISNKSYSHSDREYSSKRHSSRVAIRSPKASSNVRRERRSSEHLHLGNKMHHSSGKQASIPNGLHDANKSTDLLQKSHKSIKESHSRHTEKHLSATRDRHHPSDRHFRSEGGVHRKHHHESSSEKSVSSHSLNPHVSGTEVKSPSKKRIGREEKQKNWQDTMNNEVNPEEKTKDKMDKYQQEFDNAKLQEDFLKAGESFQINSSPADLFYHKENENTKVVTATDELRVLYDKFRYELVGRATRMRSTKPEYVPPPRKTKLRKPKPPKNEHNSSSSSSEESSSDEEDTAMEELERKKLHPDRLHEELWYNDPGEMNDGPLCRCSAKARRSGIRHGIYAGEDSLPKCNPYSNNADRLYHYRVTMSPHTNFLSKSPTTIQHDGHEYVFEGFSMFSHSCLRKLPMCKVIRFNIEYTILYVEEEFPENFTVEGLEIFAKYLFTEILELVDLNWKAYGDNKGCSRFHFMPRFARAIKGKGKELLSMNVVLQYLLTSNHTLVNEDDLSNVLGMNQHAWQDMADEVKGMIVTCPGVKPSSLRVDQIDRETCDPQKKKYPEIVHFGVRPPQLSYAGNPNYQKAWRDYVKFRHLLANKPKVVYADRHKLLQKEKRLQEMRMKNNLKRDVTVVVSSQNFYKTGIMCDIVQHAMLLPVLVCHLRFHESLDVLEEKIGYKFKDRFLLQLALTHPSYRENFGTNPDHARNSLTNCGIRQPEYGDRRIHYMNTRKRGINTLINIMSRFGRREETLSSINHNERLEFLGDAVVEFLSSIHLFFMFPDLEEGGLATYRAAIVQNQHLAVLSKKLQLEKFMLYAHGSDLCHDLELRHAMANCFEALMGALFLDDGIEVADRVFSETLFTEPELLDVWVNYPPHPLQEQEPDGDRKWIASVPILQKLHRFEEATGMEFIHIRLLARAFTHRSLGYNNLTLGSNQRLEFLGDTVLQLVASEYLYKFFPEHHEGHLSLLRSSLVNNRTQSVVCDDLGMVDFAIYPYSKVELKTKDRADLLEAFLGALYVDQGLEYCWKFCEVCFFPRLQNFIMNQDWNDPKSKLQQCCLTLRTMDGGEPDIPVYKVIECKGPTNTRVYTVAVYFRGSRLAVGSGHSIQQAEMDAAGNALKASKDLFPQLNHQKRAIERSLKQRTPHSSKSARSSHKS